MGVTASAQPTNLFLLEDLEDPRRTGSLVEGDLNSLHAIGDWIKTFVASGSLLSRSPTGPSRTSSGS